MRTLDLFAGLGGMGLAFEQAGCTTVRAVEIDKYAAQVYQDNQGLTPYADIRNTVTAWIPDYDILLAGFPCQPFSRAGKGLGFDDTRGTLFFEVARIIKDTMPRAFLLENVKGLRGHDKGRTLATIKRTLEELGYTLHIQVINARGWVAQNRERIYIVGMRDGQAYEFPTSPDNPVTLKDVLIEPNSDDKLTISVRGWTGARAHAERHAKAGNGFGYTLVTPRDLYTPTLTAHYYKSPMSILIEQPGNRPRRLSIRECANLMGLPTDYVFSVSNTQAYKMLGNSVAVPLVRAIASNMIQSLDS